MVMQIVSVGEQRHVYLSTAKRAVQSLMTQYFHDVHHCERMIEAENDRLHRQLTGVARIAESHSVSGKGGCHAMELAEAALMSEETSRDLEAFGKRYTARNKLQVELQIAIKTVMDDFGWITESMECHAHSQLQAMIDVSSAIERELEEDIERLKVQLKSERYETSKLKTEIRVLSSSYSAHQKAGQREIERLQQLLQCERSQKHEMELDSDAFREKYETQQWVAYQGAAELTHTQTELNEARLNQVFLEIENDQLQQHIRALNATVEYLVESHSSGRQIGGTAAQSWSKKAWPRIEATPPNELGDSDQEEVFSVKVVCVDDIGLDQVISYFDGECAVVPCPTWCEMQAVQVGENQATVAVLAASTSNCESKPDGWRFPEFVVCIDEICAEVSVSYL